VESLNAPAGRFGPGLVKGAPLEENATPDLKPLVEGVTEVYRTGHPWTSDKMNVKVQMSPGETATRAMEFTVIPNRDTKGNVTGAVLYGIDVTDLQGKEEQARLDRYRMMIEHAHQVALALFDAKNATLLYASPAFASLALGRLRENAVVGHDAGDEHASVAGMRWKDLGFFEVEEAGRAFEQVVNTRQPLRMTRLSLGSEENATVWDCSLIPVRESSHGRVSHVVVSAVDVTDQVRAREELERTDRLKDQFLSLASHELRTPLTPLSMYAEVVKRLLAEEDRSPEWKRKMQEAVNKFQSQITHIARLTDDLIDVARLESDRLSIERKPVDLKSVLARAREQSLAVAPSTPVNLHLPDRLERVMVSGDEGRLLQVVGNLLNNAVRHATGTEWIDLSLDISQNDGQRLARIEVGDQGPGLTPDVMETLFMRFSKGTRPSLASRSGLGLGLFISRGIIEQHGGRIRARTHEGQGSTFTVELPMSD